MRVALLSAGPSLLDTFDPDAKFDLRIGVNAAATLLHCDWWSCGDGCNVYELKPVGWPALFTCTDSDEWLKKDEQIRARVARHRVETWGAIERAVGAPGGVMTWSVTSAIPLAAWLGATSIDVYGHDMQGAVDIAGREIARRIGNYKRMSEHWRLACHWAKKRSIEIHEHKPQA